MSSPVSDNSAVRVVVLSGPSGSGKSTIVNRLVASDEVRLLKAISATTRPPRSGEVEGEDYYFLSAEEFERRKAAGEFLEFAEVFGAGYWYGTLRSELHRAAEQGAWALLEIDVEGAMNIVREYPQAVTVFLTTSSPAEYERRLRARGTESEDKIQRRLQTAASELERAQSYKHVVVNDDLDRAVREILDILSQAGDNT